MTLSVEEEIQFMERIMVRNPDNLQAKLALLQLRKELQQR